MSVDACDPSLGFPLQIADISTGFDHRHFSVSRSLSKVMFCLTNSRRHPGVFCGLHERWWIPPSYQGHSLFCNNFTLSLVISQQKLDTLLHTLPPCLCCKTQASRATYTLFEITFAGHTASFFWFCAFKSERSWLFGRTFGMNASSARNRFRIQGSLASHT